MNFQTIVLPVESISSFWLEVDEGDGNKKVYDQDGAGYPVQDVIMVSKTTCADFDRDTNKNILQLEYAVSCPHQH